MTAGTPRTARPARTPSPWRKGPNCATKRAQASYARYVVKGRKERIHG